MSEITRLKEIMKKLRDPENGCPWDIEQDFASIAPHTIEEAYEVLDAIEKNDMESLKEELGDLLLQVIFHSQMASEQNLFDFDQVAQVINNKLIERHPHVFGEAVIKNAKEQEDAWEKIKAKERDEKAKKNGDSSQKNASVLEGIANSLPALTRSVKLQKRAAKVGFDWSNIEQVFEKIGEESGELKDAIESGDNDHIEEEYGDLLFAVSNLGRKLSIDPEMAVRRCNAKFEKRFRYIEECLQKRGKQVTDSSLEEMDQLWEESKKF